MGIPLIDFTLEFEYEGRTIRYKYNTITLDISLESKFDDIDMRLVDIDSMSRMLFYSNSLPRSYVLETRKQLFLVLCPAYEIFDGYTEHTFELGGSAILLTKTNAKIKTESPRVENELRIIPKKLFKNRVKATSVFS